MFQHEHKIELLQITCYECGLIYHNNRWCICKLEYITIVVNAS